MASLRMGVDVGGTKIEAVLLAAEGAELDRARVPTPQDYAATLAAITELVCALETKWGPATVGVGMPGAIVPATELVKNANREWLNGRPFQRDLERQLDRRVRCANDADCFAISEAHDGAGGGAPVVFAAILGTGCGAGLVVDGRLRAGANGVAGEWGHNALPWPTDEEYPGPACYCGKHGCLEMWLAGPALAADHQRATGVELAPATIAERAAGGEAAACATLERYTSRLGRGLATVVNLLDPDVIVLGGGLSNVDALYPRLPTAIAHHVFGGECRTPVRRALHGAASGVRGAAWLWNAP